jgi:hypothetical protein
MFVSLMVTAAMVVIPAPEPGPRAASVPCVYAVLIDGARVTTLPPGGDPLYHRGFVSRCAGGGPPAPRPGAPS